MASGIDPSILLQSTNIQEQAQKFQTAMAAAQAQRQQLQLGNYQVAQAKQNFEDQQNMRQAWRQANGDPTAAMAIAEKLGVSPAMLTQFQQRQMQLQQMLDTHNKTVADTGETQLNTMIARNDQIAGRLQPLADAKDTSTFESQKQQVLQGLNGLATQDEMLQLSQANQQQVQDWITGHQSVKAHAAIITANAAAQRAGAQVSEAQTRSDEFSAKKAGEIADSNEKALNGAATALYNAYQSGGPVAYNKALQQYAGNDLITGSMPTPDKLAVMNPADALKTINYAGMTSQQRTTAQQQAQNEAQRQQFQNQEIRLRQQSNQIQAAMLGLDNSKTQAALYTAGLDANGKPLADTDKTLLQPNVQNTSNGATYINQDQALKGLPRGQQMQLKQAAANAGIPMLDGKTSQSVADADTARNMINQVFGVFAQHAGAGTSGTLMKIPQAIGNYAAAQSGFAPDLKAARANFLTSIESLKSAGGTGSGLRITGAEINKIGKLQPSLGDTQQELQAKAAQINQLLNDKIAHAIHKVPVTGAAPAQSAPALPKGFDPSAARAKYNY